MEYAGSNSWADAGVVVDVYFESRLRNRLGSQSEGTIIFGRHSSKTAVGPNFQYDSV